MSSPRTWGCFQQGQTTQKSALVFPTHVGVFLGKGDYMKQHVSLPHARGGVSRTPRKYPSSRKSSPRTWGCFFPELADADPSLVFPTHVGVFLAPDSLRSETRGLPHARGGVSRQPRGQARLPASSPRTWGCFFAGHSNHIVYGVFPTHVGVFPKGETSKLLLYCLPHARGGVSPLPYSLEVG